MCVTMCPLKDGHSEAKGNSPHLFKHNTLFWAHLLFRMDLKGTLG